MVRAEHLPDEQYTYLMVRAEHLVISRAST